MSRYRTNPSRTPLLAVDPGKNALGWAYYSPGGILMATGVVRADHVAAGVGGAAVTDVARHVLNELELLLGTFEPAAGLVVEQMQVYRGPQQKGDPNDLIELSYISGGVHRLPVVRRDAEHLLVVPHDWKGQAKKDVMQTRIRESLTDLERQLFAVSVQAVPASLQHNAWDAVGLGLWALKRARWIR